MNVDRRWLGTSVVRVRVLAAGLVMLGGRMRSSRVGFPLTPSRRGRRGHALRSSNSLRYCRA